MNLFRKATAVFLIAAVSTLCRAVEDPSPGLAPILQHVQARAKLEADNDRLFDQRYSYSREKITEFRNGAGQLKKRDDKTSAHQASPASPAPAPATTTVVVPQKNDAISDTHTNVRGQPFKRNDFLQGGDLLDRFQLKLAGQEIVNGRPAWRLDFVPADKQPPERNLKDRFINKAAGRLWVDAAEYSLVKVDMHLTKQVDVALGLVGAVWKFTYSFERRRTDDGLWFTRQVDWHLEGREVIVRRTVDYHEETKDLHEVNSAKAR
jgi:hypothetical protein